jgi:hypothetical protein
MVMIWFFSFLIALLLASLHLWLLSIPILSGGVFVAQCGLWLVGLSMWYRQSTRDQIDSQMYYWMQTLLTTLSIKKTITETFVNVVQQYQLKKEHWIDPYMSNDSLHALRNLKQRFTHPLYGLFITTLEFYEEQGGDVLILFDSILQQTRMVESRRIEIQTLTKRYFFQWVFLWILNLFILLMSKFVLMDLFDVMKTNVIFITTITSVVLYFPLSHLWWLQSWQQRKRKTL